MTNRAYRRSSTILGLLVLFASTACSSHPAATDRTPADDPRTDQALHNQLPADIRARGSLRIVTDASYPPASSFAADGRTIVGFEPDLGAALGSVLGVNATFVNQPFAELKSAIQSGHADLIMSAMTDTTDREKQLDFVDYFSAGTTLVVQRGNPHAISDLRSLCGEKVAVETDTVQASLLTREQTQCGKNPIQIVVRSTNDDALIQLRTGQVAALPMDFPPAQALASNPHTADHYQLATNIQYEPGQYGIGVNKSRYDLRDTIQAALTQLLQSGRYAKILAKWHVAGGAVTQIALNAG